MKTRKQAINSVRSQSAGKHNIAQGNRVYVFQSSLTNQYFKSGEYYTQAVGQEKSFNLAAKKIVAVYQNGKKIR